MATNTSPDNLLKPQVTDQIAPLETVLGNMMDSVQTALTNRNKTGFILYTTKSAMDAVPGTQVGQHALVYNDPTAANNGDYVWTGAVWDSPPLVTPANFLVHATGASTVSSSYTFVNAWAAPDYSRNFGWAGGVLTVQKPGIYRITVEVATPSNGVNSLLITKNSGVVSSGVILRVQQSGLTSFGAAPALLAAGDQLRMFAAGPTASQVLQAETFMAVDYVSAR